MRATVLASALLAASMGALAQTNPMARAGKAAANQLGLMEYCM